MSGRGDVTFKLQRALARWRGRQERVSSLSPREVDELEDHLRARVDLELELNPELTQAQAFAAASEELGDPRALSSEFAKAGRAGWKGLLVTGWLLFAASFLLPTIDRPFLFRPPPPPPGTPMPPGTGTVPDPMPGWDVFAEILSGFLGPLGMVSALSNVLIPLTGLCLLRGWKMSGRWMVYAMIGATGMNLFMWMPVFFADLQVGYYAWVASFVLVTVAWWRRNRGWSPARVEKVVA